MTRVFFKYYIDITRINLLVTLFFGIMTNFIVCFGTFGMAVAFVVYQKFQNDQYYFYFNQGFTKSELILKTFAINFLIALLLFLLVH